MGILFALLGKPAQILSVNIFLTKGSVSLTSHRHLVTNGFYAPNYKRLSQEKEALYRDIYQPIMKPVSGLLDFLAEMAENNIPMAIATSAIPENVEFVTSELNIKEYFPIVINETHVTKGKPDPQVYLLTTAKLGFEPAQCFVIEDSLSGVESGVAAGCIVIGLTTTHTREELSNATLVIDSFEDLDYDKLVAFMA